MSYLKKIVCSAVGDEVLWGLSLFPCMAIILIVFIYETVFGTAMTDDISPESLMVIGISCSFFVILYVVLRIVVSRKVIIAEKIKSDGRNYVFTKNSTGVKYGKALWNDGGRFFHVNLPHFWTDESDDWNPLEVHPVYVDQKNGIKVNLRMTLTYVIKFEFDMEEIYNAFHIGPWTSLNGYLMAMADQIFFNNMAQLKALANEFRKKEIGRCHYLNAITQTLVPSQIKQPFKNMYLKKIEFDEPVINAEFEF